MAREKVGSAGEAFALSSALGSLALLGMFLIADGSVDVFSVVERYAKTSTWALIAALPLIVLTYLLGLFIELVSSAVLPRIAAFFATRTFELTEQDDFLLVARLANDAITQRYLALIHDRRLLDGSALPLILLGIGALSEQTRMMKEFGRDVGSITVTIAAFALLGGVVAPIAGHFKGKAARSFAAAADNRSA